MQSPILSSTFFLTLLMMIGLVFFIRASTKERIEVIQFAIAQPLEKSLGHLQSYFLQRSYRAIPDAISDATSGEATQSSDSSQHPSNNYVSEQSVTKQVFEGMVRPSVFLAILLFVLASIGFLCLALVLSILLPQLGTFIWSLVLLAPMASFFYWKKSSRVEQVSFKVEPLSGKDVWPDNPPHDGQNSPIETGTKVTVMGHRDELASLQQALVQQSLRIRTLEADLG